jgi:hypothetical protein
MDELGIAPDAVVRSLDEVAILLQEKSGKVTEGSSCF